MGQCGSKKNKQVPQAKSTQAKSGAPPNKQTMGNESTITSGDVALVIILTEDNDNNNSSECDCGGCDCDCDCDD
jgi:hypothetical protein